MSDFENFDHLFDPVIVLNSKREIVYFNNQSSIFFKMPPRIFKQKNNIIQICDSIDFDIEAWLGKALLSFEIMTSPEIRLTIPHEKDVEYTVIVKLIPIQTSKGTLFATVFHDMTVETNLYAKYREQLEELKKTHNQILQADKLTTLGELTANISHEINNPLTIASGHTEIIKSYLHSKDPIAKIPNMKDAIVTIGESLDRVNQIILNMKDFLHQSEDHKEYCDLEALVENAIDWVQQSASKANVKIVKEFKAQRPVALANRIKIEQVIINLIKNSIDAIRDARIENGIVTISLLKSDATHQTYIDVTDNGPGLSPQIKENLFKPFQTTKEAGTGTGLGLSICSKILDDHRGKLDYIDGGPGCRFRLKLPMIEAYSYTRNERTMSSAKLKKRILVLDNEVQILNVLNSFIHEDGYVFIGSSDPIDALKFLEKADLDLIISDYSMPEMNGAEFSEKARASGYEGPILYMTSAKFIDQYNKDKDELGIDGLIVKPFNRDEVLKLIRLALKGK
jgi:signal transduction histidine kinase/CheY-like chemotaxis protein